MSLHSITFGMIMKKYFYISEAYLITEKSCIASSQVDEQTGFMILTFSSFPILLSESLSSTI